MPQNGTGYTESRFQLATYAKFNRPDPMRDWDWLRPHTMNLYEYVGNDPVNMWDPTGLVLSDRQLMAYDVSKMGASGEEIMSSLKAYDEVQKPAQELIIKSSIESSADTYGDAFELITGYTITGDKGSRGFAAVAIVVPFVSSKALKGLGNLVEVISDSGEKATKKVLEKTSDASSDARFITEPNGTTVDLQTTPTGSFDQPNQERTDILQQSGDHGAGHSHTHPPDLNTAPNGITYVNGTQNPGVPVSAEDLKNIQSGKAPRTKSKGR